jgi:hypothetical protein
VIDFNRPTTAMNAITVSSFQARSIHPAQAGLSSRTTAAGVDRSSAHRIAAPAAAQVIAVLTGIFLL